MPDNVNKLSNLQTAMSPHRKPIIKNTVRPLHAFLDAPDAKVKRQVEDEGDKLCIHGVDMTEACEECEEAAYAEE